MLAAAPPFLAAPRVAKHMLAMSISPIGLPRYLDDAHSACSARPSGLLGHKNALKFYARAMTL